MHCDVTLYSIFRSYRYAAYRQFTWWVHGRLGPNKRYPIPACATHAIRTQYPSPDNVYEGYQSVEED